MSTPTRPNLSAFLNPEPAAKSGEYLDASNDIYDHTRDFFAEKGLTQFEANERKIRPDISDIQLDDKVYGSKKVTR